MEYGEADCHYCKIPLIFANPEGRDTETMGGLDVEYLQCPECATLYSHISGDLPNETCEECSI